MSGSDARTPDRSISIARALGIATVVLGHLPNSPPLYPFLPYSFHMPLFFFLAGLVLRPDHFEQGPKYLLGRIRRIMVPFFAFYFGLAGVGALLGWITGGQYLNSNWLAPNVALLNIFTVGGGVPLFFTGWFLTSLLVASLAAWPVYLISSRWKYGAIAILPVLLVAAIASMQFGQHKLQTPGYQFLDLVICRNVVALFFLWCGHVFSQYMHRVSFGTALILALLWAAQSYVVAQTGKVIFFTGTNDYKSLWIPFVTSFLGIGFVLGLASLLSKSGSPGWLEHLGNRSLYIMALHPLAFQVVSLLAHAASGGASSDLNSVYYYAPAVYWPLYLLAGLILPVLWAELWIRLKKRALLALPFIPSKSTHRAATVAYPDTTAARGSIAGALPREEHATGVCAEQDLPIGTGSAAIPSSSS